MEGDIQAIIYRYVFTHYDEFKRGVSLASIKIPNITASDIVERIDHICKSYQKPRAKHQNIRECIIYTIKPREDIPEFYKAMEEFNSKPHLAIELSHSFEVMPVNEQANLDEQTIYGEHSQKISQQHFDLNAVEKYVVDNYERFIKGICLEQIHIKGYKSTGLARKLNAICNIKRTTLKQYKKEYGEDFIPTTKQVRVYSLKPKDEIPDFYKIIEYIEFNKHSDTSEETLPDVPQEEEQDDLTTTIIKNKELFKLGIKRSWLKKLGIRYIPGMFGDEYFNKREYRCDSKNAKELRRRYELMGIPSEVYSEDFKNKRITIYRLSGIP